MSDYIYYSVESEWIDSCPTCKSGHPRIYAKRATVESFEPLKVKIDLDQIPRSSRPLTDESSAAFRHRYDERMRTRTPFLPEFLGDPPRSTRGRPADVGFDLEDDAAFDNLFTKQMPLPGTTVAPSLPKPRIKKPQVSDDFFSF